MGKTTKRSLWCRAITHWFALRLWVAGFLALLISYTLWISPSTLSDIVDKGELRIGYVKYPDNGYVYNDETYGFELKIIEKYAEQNELSLKMVEIDLESMSMALNINKIDIGIGGLTAHSINPEKNTKTDVWDEQTLCIVELRTQGKKSTFDIKSKTNLIHVGNRFTDQQTLETLQNAMPDAVFHSNEISEIDLLDKVQEGGIQYALTTLGRLRVIQHIFPELRRVHTFKKQRKSLVWMLPKYADKAFVHSLNSYLINKDTLSYKRELSNQLFKKPKHFHFLDGLKIKEHIESRLFQYEQWFKLAGKEYDIDWTLLAALAYQESRWSVEAVSPTKVRGIMQITTDTAKSLGIDNRLDAFSTIFAGAKYLSDLRKRIPKRVQEPDRTKMALGSYNIGFGYILTAYKDARKGNFKTVTWQDIEDRLPTVHRLNQYDEVDVSMSTFPRGYQAIKYVARIEEFHQILRYYAAE